MASPQLGPQPEKTASPSPPPALSRPLQQPQLQHANGTNSEDSKNGNGSSTTPAPAPAQNKRPHGGATPPKRFKQKKTKREKNITEGSSEDVLRHDIRALLDSQSEGDAGENEAPSTQELPAEGSEVDVQVMELSSTGDGLAMIPGSKQVYVVPFTVPGDTVRVKAYRHLLHDPQPHTIADFIRVVQPSPLRDDSRIRCKYFASCGGCQFQMLDYTEQLRRKRRIVEKAFANFANLRPESIPSVGDTVGSPLQYGYRTKLTPHFDGPPGFRPSKRGKNPKTPFPECPDIGFMQKGKRKVLDIEDCPIGTDVVRLGITRERARMKDEYANYKRGATILLRENTERKMNDKIEAGEESVPAALPSYTTRVDNDNSVDIKTCVTDSKATTTEYIGSYVFTNPAGSFFQNNNSILPTFTSYIRDNVLPPASPPSTSSSPIKFLIDAYSGSGLFTITLSSTFTHSTGIDIAADSIASANQNAALNGLGPDRCTFIAADAGQLFANVTYPPDETAVILDPPRKGCDADFLAQLRRFAPKRIVYVSCNVHTQARDVGVLVRGEGEGARYDIESLRGFDFFPQTGHVEGVAVLNRCDE